MKYDDLPPCMFYVSIEQPECGRAAPHKVLVRTALVNATVDLCNYHKKRHDKIAEERRKSFAAAARKAN